MSRKIVMPKATVEKDANGLYTRPEPRPSPPAPEPPTSDVDLDHILDKQLLALARVTVELLKRSTEGVVHKDYVQSLATCIKITMELKQRQKDLFDDLKDDDLEKIANDE